MNAPLGIRATLLGSLVVLSGCDVAQLVTDPAPHFEQTWNLPASSSTISVAELLPSDSSVKILPDSSGFSLKPGNVSVSIGCAACASLNGTTAIKPAFDTLVSSTTALATDVVSAKVLGGTATLTLTNNLTFDPIKVRASGTQGHLVLIVHSGSIPLGTDSIDGATTPFPAGGQLTRTIALTRGDALAGLTVDVHIVSPQGDTPVPIIASRAVAVAASVPALSAATIGLVVNGKIITSAKTSLDLDGLDKNITGSVSRGAIVMTVDNPFAITGNMDVKMGYGSAAADTLLKTVPLPSGLGQIRTVSLERAEMEKVLGKKSSLIFGGTVSAALPISVGPRQRIDIGNRLELRILTGGGQ